MKKNVFISVVSHHQEDLIKSNFGHFPKELGDFNIKVFIMDNVGSNSLKEYCYDKGLYYYCDGTTRGFGENHNKMFDLISPKIQDTFIVCNPDIIIHKDQLLGLLENFHRYESDIYSVTTYFDKAANIKDNPDKHFPGFLNFPISLLTDNRLHYGTNQYVKSPQWISGGFMVFNAFSFKRLHGFDESYFMYCEDMDICYRARNMGMSIIHDKKYYIEHDAQMASRIPFSKSMIMHVKSSIQFVFKTKQFAPITIAH